MKLAITVRVSPESGVDMETVWEAERLGYEAVKSIWATYGHLMPTERGFWNSLYT